VAFVPEPWERFGTKENVLRLSTSRFLRRCAIVFGFGVLGSLISGSTSLIAQSQQLQTIIAPPPDSEDRNTLGLLSASDQTAVAQSPIPVLIPAEKQFVRELKFVFEEQYYAWSSVASGVEVPLEGSRLAYVNRDPSLAAIPKTDTIRDIRGIVTLSEHIWYASWQEFGASYVLGLACEEAKDDRCASDKYLLQTASSLRYVGGGRTKGKIQLAATIQGGTANANQCSQSFPCNLPGKLVSGSGQGREDYTIYAADIRFPVEKKDAYANSQVWGAGGANGPGGGECASANYSYPWWDNFCETRPTRATPMCPTRTGHQGQDIRPPTCVKDVHVAVSSVNGKITHVGKFTLYVTAKDGTRFDYLHMSNVKLRVGLAVKKGDRLGTISNVFDGTPTTIHLHFEIFQNIAGIGLTHVPPYMSLVKSYEQLP
jgi:murein DD-endopeptidase MepM/ murein hydrolase activator NlpD